MQEQPYFMENPKWYRFNEKEWKYELTDEAPEKAVESYKEFYNDKMVIDGEEVIIDY